MTLDEKIVKLTDLWFELVSIDHHKDRDCHWYIEIDWAYGQKPIYTVAHFGYIYNKDVNIDCETLEGAKKLLIKEIKQAFKEEYSWAQDVIKHSNEWDKYDINRAKNIIKICEKVREID